MGTDPERRVSGTISVIIPVPLDDFEEHLTSAPAAVELKIAAIYIFVI